MFCHFRIASKCIIPGVTMAEHVYSSFIIKNDNDPKVFHPVNSLRGISEHYSMSRSLLYLCIHFNLYKPE